MISFTFLLRITALCVLFLSAHANSQPLISTTEYWMDKTGYATYEEASKANFTPYSGNLQLGYTKSIVWVKFRIDGIQDLKSLVLTIKPSFLKDVRLYESPRVIGVDPAYQQSGRNSSILEASYPGVENGFKIQSSTTARDLFLRIDTPTSLILHMSLTDEKTAVKENQERVHLLEFYVGFLFLSAFWGLVNWVIQKDALYGLFLIRQIYAAVYSISYTGLLRYGLNDTVSVEVQEVIYNFVVVTIVLTFGLFETQLLGYFGVSSRLKKITRAIVYLSLVSILLLFFDETMQALRFNVALVSIFALFLVILAFTAKRDQSRTLESTAVWSIRIGYAIFLMTTFLPMLSFQGLFIAHWLVIDMLILPSAVSSLLMLILLAIRTRKRDLNMHNNLLQETLVKSKLNHEIEKRKEKENFLSMLIHELRNPLSVIKMRTDEESGNGKIVQKAASEIAQVLNRIEQSEKIDEIGLSVVINKFQINSLIYQLKEYYSHEDRLVIGKPPIDILATDKDILKSILINIIDNAFKYSQPDSLIHFNMMLSSLENKKGVTFLVQSAEGACGLPDESKVFSKFYRAPAAHQHIGSGLGLYLIQHWVKSLNGNAGYKANLSKEGLSEAQFTVWIPL